MLTAPLQAASRGLLQPLLCLSPSSLGRLEVKIPALEVVLHPARSAHHNINPPAQGALLGPVGGPTIQAQRGEMGCPAHMLKVSGHLQDTQGLCLVAILERST